MIRFPNRTAQAGVFKTGTPNYIDVSSGAAEAGMITFIVQEAAGEWVDGDTIGIVAKSGSNYVVWTATWDATNKYLLLATEEEIVGAISDGQSVTVMATLTSNTFSTGIDVPTQGHYITDATTARTLSPSDAGQVIRFTNASAVTVTLTSTLPVGFQCMIAQVGAGVVSCARQSTDTVNGGTTAVALAKQWATAYVCQPTEGAWEVYA